jgi:SAM-dependent methyltransferase
VGFQVSADAYLSYMGRFSAPLAAVVVDRVDPQPGRVALDVGCGPGVVTALLVDRLGVGAVSAVDPSPTFVAAVRQRWPDLDVRRATAEQLPYPDATFDLTVAQLVVHFMADPVAGLAQMRRVTRADGVVTASVWDYDGLRGPVDDLWRAVRELDPGVAGEGTLPGTRDGHLRELARSAGLRQVEQQTLTVTAHYGSFNEWWHTFTLGVGPAGSYVAGLAHHHRETLRERCRAVLPTGPFDVPATAWSITARA